MCNLTCGDVHSATAGGGRDQRSTGGGRVGTQRKGCVGMCGAVERDRERGGGRWLGAEGSEVVRAGRGRGGRRGRVRA